MAHRFTFGESKIWQNIEKSQNIMKLIVGFTAFSFSLYLKRKDLIRSLFYSNVVRRSIKLACLTLKIATASILFCSNCFPRNIDKSLYLTKAFPYLSFLILCYR